MKDYIVVMISIAVFALVIVFWPAVVVERHEKKYHQIKATCTKRELATIAIMNGVLSAPAEWYYKGEHLNPRDIPKFSVYLAEELLLELQETDVLKPKVPQNQSPPLSGRTNTEVHPVK